MRSKSGNYDLMKEEKGEKEMDGKLNGNKQWQHRSNTGRRGRPERGSQRVPGTRNPGLHKTRTTQIEWRKGDTSRRHVRVVSACSFRAGGSVVRGGCGGTSRSTHTTRGGQKDGTRFGAAVPSA